MAVYSKIEIGNPWSRNYPLVIDSNSRDNDDRNRLAAHGLWIGKKISSGSFCDVHFAAKKLPTGRKKELAVKIIDKSKVSPLFKEKFLSRELSIWPNLRHSHIIQCDQIFQIKDKTYIFMELAPGGTVTEYIQRWGAVNEMTARIWFQALCDALRYCHQRGVAHRDIKCDNLLLDAYLQIKVADFGFCCSCYDIRSGAKILSDTYCGSAAYVAPEVIEGDFYDPIPADIWSIGICLYVMLNNALPFDDRNIRRMHEAQTKRKWTFAPSVVHSLSTEAKHLIMSLIEPVVNLRPKLDQVINSPWMSMHFVQ